MNGLTGWPIVVGVEDSPAARMAALWAAGQAMRHRVELRLVHAIAVSGPRIPGGYTPCSDFASVIENAARQQVQSLSEEVRQTYPELSVRVSLRSDHPVSLLIDESRSAALVVVGAPMHNTVRGLLAGATAVSVAAHAHCPTAVIRARGDEFAGGKVVVGIDGSPASEAAVGVAFAEASLRGGELVAVHGWNDFTSDASYAYALQSLIDWTAVMVRERETLAERLAGWQEKYPDVVVSRVVVREKAASLLLEQSQDAQLLVVGSRGRGGFAGMLLGSASQRLMHRVTCPLIIAR